MLQHAGQAVCVESGCFELLAKPLCVHGEGPISVNPVYYFFHHAVVLFGDDVIRLITGPRVR